MANDERRGRPGRGHGSAGGGEGGASGAGGAAEGGVAHEGGAAGADARGEGGTKAGAPSNPAEGGANSAPAPAPSEAGALPTVDESRGPRTSKGCGCALPTDSDSSLHHLAAAGLALTLVARRRPSRAARAHDRSAPTS